VVTGPAEATAAGNILMQAVALGALESVQQARAVVRNSFEVSEFEPATGTGWDEAYGKLMRLIEK